jgi:hypothetical protein
MKSDFDYYNQVVHILKQEVSKTKLELAFLRQSKFFIIYRNWHRFKDKFVNMLSSSDSNNSISKSMIEARLLSNAREIDPKKKLVILFSHDASITGAPKVLIELADLLTQNLNFEVLIFFVGKGELIKQVEKKYKVFYCDLNNYLTDYNQKVSELIVSELKKLRFDFDIEMILLNTLTLGEVAFTIKDLGIKIVSWIHELGSVVDLVGEDNCSIQLQLSDRIIFDSAKSKNFIESKFSNINIASKSIYLENPIIRGTRFNEFDLRKHLGIDSRAFVILTVGTRQFRKGFDIYPHIIRETNQLKVPNVFFAWIGPRFSYREDTEVYSDFELFKIKNVFVFDPVENLDDYISQSNLVLNVSREDSNSLVLRTAINIGTPVVNLEEELTSYGLVSYSEFNISNFAKLLINKLLYGANEGK